MSASTNTFRTAVHIVAVSGSLRKVSTNTGLIRAALKVIPQDTTMEVVEIGDLPLFSEDLEKLPLPESVERVRAAFDRADAFLFATPENNYNIAAALKNAFDWASRTGTIYKHTHPLADKPFHVMGSGGGMGGMRGGFALKQMAIPVNMWPLNNPQVWIRRYEGKYFDENGDLIDDKWKQSIAALVQALVDYTRRLRYGAIILKQQKEDATKSHS